MSTNSVVCERHRLRDCSVCLIDSIADMLWAGVSITDDDLCVPINGGTGKGLRHFPKTVNPNPVYL